MNIKQAAEQTGVSSRNIRYYEQAGLLHPDRDPDNDYRTYSAADLRTLKLIRALRMLDMPLEEIRAVLQGSLPLGQAAARQQQRLQEKARSLEAAIRFCGDLQQQDAATLDVDACLARMERTPDQGWFRGWLQDYRAMARVEHRRSFTFTPDTPVTTPAEFSNALFAYAQEHGLDLVITRESMNPRFTIDGIEYRANRYYYPFRGVPTARIRCFVCDPDFAEADVAPGRLRLQKALHYLLPVALMAAVVLLFLVPRGLLTTWWGWLVLVALIALGVSGAWYNAHIFYNDKDNQPHDG